MNQAIDKIIHDNHKELGDMIAGGLDVSMSFGRSKRQLLHVAASFGACNCLGVLLKSGLDVNLQDNTGVTSVHLAARNGHKRCLRMLVEQFKADIRIVDCDGYTAMHSLACNGRTELLAYVLGLSGLASVVDDMDRQCQVGFMGYVVVHGVCGRVVIVVYQPPVLIDAHAHPSLTPSLTRTDAVACRMSQWTLVDSGAAARAPRAHRCL